MKAGYYSDKYFVRARDVLIADGHDPVVTIQVFQKNRAWVAGTDEAIAILKLCLTDGYSFSDLEVSSLRDGDRVGPWETGSSPELCVKVRGSSSMLLLGCLGDLLRFEKREIQVATFAPGRSSP